mgnify:CR=1 FL=1
MDTHTPPLIMERLRPDQILIQNFKSCQRRSQLFRGYEDELETIEDGFWKSMDYMINSQNEAGGWPQYYPYGVGYFKLDYI